MNGQISHINSLCVIKKKKICLKWMILKSIILGSLHHVIHERFSLHFVNLLIELLNVCIPLKNWIIYIFFFCKFIEIQWYFCLIWWVLPNFVVIILISIIMCELFFIIQLNFEEVSDHRICVCITKDNEVNKCSI